MATIIGSSSVNSGNAGGPTGNTGPTGPTGNTGNAGITKGATGATSDYILLVDSNRANNEISFQSAYGGIITTLSGFTGPTGAVYNSTGVSAAYDTNHKTPVKDVTGFTFSFYGISGGTSIAITLRSDKTKIIATYNPGTTPYPLNTKTDYVGYIETTSIGGGTTGINPTRIYSDANNILYFGLTGIPSGTTANYLFSNFAEDICTVESVTSKTNGGITLNFNGLTACSNYWIKTPIGITAFSGNTWTNTRQEYTLFVEGSDVWNLPKNLYLQNTVQGVNNYSFLEGINILHVWSDNGGTTYDGVFIERGIGPATTFSIGSSSAIGSCCNAGVCVDGVSRTACAASSGDFSALIPCNKRTSANCATIQFAATSGACCCGATGCVDSTNAPSGVVVDASFCNKIGGKFYVSKSCGIYDKAPNYSSGRSNTVAIPGIICHSCRGTPVACCIPDGAGGYNCSQETEEYCTSIRGTPFVGKTCTQINCADELATGYCRRNNICNSGILRSACLPCGEWNASSCPSTTETGAISILTDKPSIRLIHSISNNNVLASYSQSASDTALRFTVSGSTPYKLDGEIQVLDAASPSTTNIWALSSSTCLNISITDNLGTPVTANTVLDTTKQYNVVIGANKTYCTDLNFKAALRLKLISCSNGLVSSSEKSVDLIYTESPCTCLAVSTTGDVVNKAAIVVPFIAERYCTHCTKAELNIKGTFAHIPYPIKRQTGLLTFCPPTGLSGTSCGILSSFCVRYNEIEELSGCTYSSRFDGNGDFKIANVNVSVPSPNPLAYSSFEGNTLPSGCFHAEYNVPGSGTTYYHKYDPGEALYPNEVDILKAWYAVAGNSDNPDIPVDRATFTAGNYKVNYIRPYTNKCKRVMQINSNDCDNTLPFDDTICDSGLDDQRHACYTWPGQAGTWDGNSCIERYAGNPYYNTIKFDDDALTYVANLYGAAPYFLQQKINEEIKKYGDLFDPNVDAGSISSITVNSRYNVGALTEQQKKDLLIDPLSDIGGSSIDVDDKARASCEDCKQFFDKDNKIQIPITSQNDITGIGGYTYRVYGLVLEKIKECTVAGPGVTGDVGICKQTFTVLGPGLGTEQECRDTVNNHCAKQKQTEKQIKYYAIIIKGPKRSGTKCMMVYDLGEQRVIYGGNLNSNNGTVYCRGGDVICPLDCESPVKIKEYVWLGDLTTSSVDFGSSICSDTRKLFYTLTNINKTFTGFDDYTYTPISNIFTVTGLATDSSSMNIQFAKNTFVDMMFNVFCKTGSTDYFNSRCSVCSSDNCYSDVIPKLMEFIGDGCSVEGFSCNGAGSMDTGFGITFINNTDVGITDINKTVVKTINNNSVYWLTESTYNSNNTNYQLTLTPSTSSCILGDSPDYTCTQYRFDSRIYKNHNINYLYLNDNTIKLSKSVESRPGSTTNIYTNYNFNWDTFGYNNSCSSNTISIPRLNMTGYRPSITIDNLVVEGDTTTGFTVKFVPSGVFFDNSLTLEQNISNNDLNIKIISVVGTSIQDVTSTYIIGGDHSINYNINGLLSTDGEAPDEYCKFYITQNLTSFSQQVSAKNIYLLFNVNNWDDDIGLNVNKNYPIIAALYEKYFKSLEYSVDDTSLQNLTQSYNDYLGDFLLSRITRIFGPGFAPTVQTTRKNIMGTCINIDCTNIADLCADLQGC